MSRIHGIHWLAPTTMVGSFIAGILFAMGHHLFYQRLAGNAVSAENFHLLGSSMSRQEASIAIGNAIAFLVKSCLVFAISVAFFQVLWRKISAKSAAPTLSTVDDIWSAISNLLVLFNLPLWLKYPLLLLIATTAWLVPIASIITPATLSTRWAQLLPSPVRPQQVPSLDFRSFMFVDKLDHEDWNINAQEYDYTGPSHSVLTTVAATMAMEVRRNLFTYLTLQPADRMGTSNSIILHEYLGWFPSFGRAVDGTPAPYLPFLSETANETLQFKDSTTGIFSERLHIFVASRKMREAYHAAFPQVEHVNGTWFKGLASSSESNIPDFIDGTTLSCGFYNSTYHVAFNYTNGEQNISVQTSSMNSINATSMLGRVIGPGPSTYVTNKTCVMLSVDWTANADPNDAPERCSFDSELLGILSYQAIWDAFTRTLQGMVSSHSGDSSVLDYSSCDDRPGILSTALLNAPELAFLRSSRNVRDNATLQDVLTHYDNPELRGLTNSLNEITQPSLRQALEEMFHKIVVSLMASSALQPNQSSITAPGPVNVTFPTYRIEYVYSIWKLWVPYGIAILLTSIAVTIGLATMFLSGASYNNSFSAVFRTAKGAELSESIKEQDMNGTDPLPKYAAAAWVTIRRQRRVSRKEDVAYKRISPLDAPVDMMPHGEGHRDGYLRVTRQMSGKTLQRSSTRSTL